MKISGCFTVMNERSVVANCWPLSKDPAVDEWLISDNGSTDGVGEMIRDRMETDVFVRFKNNVGIAHSHNPLFAQATGELIILTGCNRVPPKNYASTFRSYFEAIPDLMAACFYNDGANAEERIFSKDSFNSQWEIVPGVIMDVICFRREVFKQIGYYDTGFGLYGYEDLEFSARLHRWCKENRKLAGVIPTARNRHFGFNPHDAFDPSLCSREYYELKKSECGKQSEKTRRFNELAAQGFPYFSPY